MQGHVFNKQFLETRFDGEYHAPELRWDDIEAPSVLFPRTLPKWSVVHHTDINSFWRLLWTEHDADTDGKINEEDTVPFDFTNEGIEDKFDPQDNKMIYNPLVGPDGWKGMPP